MRALTMVTMLTMLTNAYQRLPCRLAAEVGAAVAEAATAEQHYSAALGAANEASRRGEDARALVVSTEARAAAAEGAAKERKEQSLQWIDQLKQERRPAGDGGAGGVTARHLGLLAP